MFKNFFPKIASGVSSSLAGDISSRSDVAASESTSSRQSSSGSTEEINKSDIPSLKRRHSFSHPYVVSVLEEENNKHECSELSINPFDSPILKRSKSLSFHIVKKPSISSFKRKIIKSVHFDKSIERDEEEIVKIPKTVSNSTQFPIHDEQNSPQKSLSSDYSDGSINSSNDENIRFNSMKDYRLYENEVQRTYSLELNDSIDPNSTGDSPDTINGSRKDDEEWFNRIAKDSIHLNLDKSSNGSISLRTSETRSVADSKGEGAHQNSRFDYKIAENYLINDPNDELRIKKNSSLDQDGVRGLISFEDDPTFRTVADNEIEISEQKINKILKNLSVFNSQNRSLNYKDNIELFSIFLKLSEEANNSIVKRDLDIAEITRKLESAEHQMFEKEIVLQECNSLTEKMKALNVYKAKLEKELATSKEQLDELKIHQSNKCSKLEDESFSQDNENNLKVEIINLFQKYDKVVDLKTDIKEYIKDLLVSNNSLKDENTRLNKECEVKVEELEGLLLSQQVRLSNEKSAKESIILEFDNEINIIDENFNFDDYFKQLLVENKDLKEDNNKLVEENHSKEKELSSLNESLKNYNDALKSVRMGLDTIVNEKEELVVEHNILAAKFSNLEKEKCILIEKVEEVSRELASKNDELRKANDSFFEVQSNIMILQEERDELKLKNEEYIEQMRESDTLLRESSLSIDKMNENINLLKKQMDLEMDKKEFQISSLNEKINEKDSIINELKDNSIQQSIKLDGIDVLKKEMSQIRSNNEKLTNDNQKLIQYNYEASKVLKSLNNHIEKITVSKSTVDKRLDESNKSNEILCDIMKQFFKLSFEYLSPMVYDESADYFKELYKEFIQKDIFCQNDIALISKIVHFIIRSISDLVNQYLVNEELLETEIEKRNNNYQIMLDKLTQIMEENLLKINSSKENKIISPPKSKYKPCKTKNIHYIN